MAGKRTPYQMIRPPNVLNSRRHLPGGKIRVVGLETFCHGSHISIRIALQENQYQSYTVSPLAELCQGTHDSRLPLPPFLPSCYRYRMAVNYNKNDKLTVATNTVQTKVFLAPTWLQSKIEIFLLEKTFRCVFEEISKYIS